MLNAVTNMIPMEFNCPRLAGGANIGLGNIGGKVKQYLRVL